MYTYICKYIYIYNIHVYIYIVVRRTCQQAESSEHHWACAPSSPSWRASAIQLARGTHEEKRWQCEALLDGAG